MYTTTSPNKTRVRVMVMVNDIAQTVASKDLRLEGTVTIVGLNTHHRYAQHGRKNVTSVRRNGIFPNAATQGLASSHSTGQGRRGTMWSRSPTAILSLSKTLSMSSSLETT